MKINFYYVFCDEFLNLIFCEILIKIFGVIYEFYFYYNDINYSIVL